MHLTIAQNGHRRRSERDFGDASIVTIGRAKENDLVLADPERKISRYHAVLVALPGAGHFVRDLSSRNATRVNGSMVCRRRLAEGDVIEIGPYRLGYRTASLDPGDQEGHLPLVVGHGGRMVAAVDRPTDLTDLSQLAQSSLAGLTDGRRLEALEELLRQARTGDAPAALFRSFLGPVLRAVQAQQGFVALFGDDPADCACVARQLLPHQRIHIEAEDYLETLRQGLRVDEGQVLLVPVLAGSEPVGFWCACRSTVEGGFTADDAAFLEEAGRRITAQAAPMATRSRSGPARAESRAPAADRRAPAGQIGEAGAPVMDEPLAWPMLWIGHAPCLDPVHRSLAAAAASMATLLITGETGTGKELVVQALHAASPRGAGPLVRHNCATIPKDVPELVLFGYAARTPLGQASREGKPGLIEQAHTGTLFLDEVQSLPLSAQAQLLRVLEDGQVRRIGATEALRVDVRFVLATNEDLEVAVRQGTFRADLYQRFTRQVHLPPLRERRTDIPLLAHFFLDQLAESAGTPTRWVSRGALQQLMRHPWPGNIRELRACLAQAAALGREVVFSWDLFSGPAATLLAEAAAPDDGPGAPAAALGSSPPEARQIPAVEPARPRPPRPITEVEKDAIREALEYTHGNKAQAARLLGWTWQTLDHKIKRYELTAGP